MQANHYDNHEGKTNPDLGRIYRLRGEDYQACRAIDLGELSTETLIERYLFHPNRWFRQTTLRLLGDRRDASVTDRLWMLVNSSQGQESLEALWALNLCGGLSSHRASELLDHADPHVRRWTIRLLGDAETVSPAAIAILAERKVAVIHNPTSNMKIASGIAPITEMLDAGVRVGLGTDGAASNNDLDMWEEMRLASLLQKVDRMDPEVIPATTVLRMATSGGATAIGLGDKIGSLEVGKRADLIQVAFEDVHHVPTYNVISHLVFVTDEQDVASVVVDGKVLMREREMLTIDTARVAAEATALAAKIQAALEDRNRAK